MAMATYQGNTRTADYLDNSYMSSADYVARHKFSSAVVSGNPDLTKGKKEAIVGTPTAKSVIWTYADDAVLLLAYALLRGHMESGKPFSKLAGQIPSWASTMTGVFTGGSDFTSGHSYFPNPGSPGWSGAFSVMEANRIRNGVAALTLVGSLLFGGAAQAQTPVQSSSVLQREIASVESVYDFNATTRNNASNLLYETAVHESGLLRYNRQLVNSSGKMVEHGFGRSKFMIESSTAKNLVSWAKKRPRARNLLTTESGYTYKQLSHMSRKELGNYLMTNEKFAVALARLKYASSPGSIPSTLEGQAAYWSKYYQGTNDYSKQKQFISDNRKMSEEVKASSISKVVGSHIRPIQRHPSVIGMHNNKIGHNIKSFSKKLAMRGL